MGNQWKMAVVALLTLPMGAYVVGSLVGSQAPLPDQRAPLVIVDKESSSPAGQRDRDPQRGADGPEKKQGSDDGPTVVRPVPDNLDKDPGDRDDDDADADDDDADDESDDSDDDDRDDRDD